ncbi:hypothetical protein OQA88_11291 [Cercophora sp. LCS_1]
MTARPHSAPSPVDRLLYGEPQDSPPRIERAGPFEPRFPAPLPFARSEMGPGLPGEPLAWVPRAPEPLPELTFLDYLVSMGQEGAEAQSGSSESFLASCWQDREALKYQAGLRNNIDWKRVEQWVESLPDSGEWEDPERSSWLPLSRYNTAMKASAGPAPASREGLRPSVSDPVVFRPPASVFPPSNNTGSYAAYWNELANRPLAAQKMDNQHGSFSDRAALPDKGKQVDRRFAYDNYGDYEDDEDHHPLGYSAPYGGRGRGLVSAATSNDLRSVAGYNAHPTLPTSASMARVNTPFVPPQRLNRAPAPINTESARLHAREATERKYGPGQIVDQHPPETSSSPPGLRFGVEKAGSDTSSIYTMTAEERERRFPSHISPLRINKEQKTPGRFSILQDYSNFVNSPAYVNHHAGQTAGQTSHMATTIGERDFGVGPSTRPGTSGIGASTGIGPSAGIGTSTGLVTSATTNDIYQYNPLIPFMKEELRIPRQATKTLIGHNGWLEATSTDAPTAPQEPQSRKHRFFNRLVKKAKGITTGDDQTQRKSHNSEKSPSGPRTLAISLNPREQSLLYCELELGVTSCLNDYLQAQFNNGRLETSKLKKIADAWHAQGRPKVTGFRYDMETQIDLVKLHIDHFKFYGHVTMNNRIVGILDMMKANARAMRVRTFCQPDTVIAKQLLDSQHLFNVLGATDVQHKHLAEATAFFRAAMERERYVASRVSEQLASAQGSSLRTAKSLSPEKWPEPSPAGLRKAASHATMPRDGTPAENCPGYPY